MSACIQYREAQCIHGAYGFLTCLRLGNRCPPPANLKTPCLDSAAYATTASGGVAVVAALLSAIVAMVF